MSPKKPPEPKPKPEPPRRPRRGEPRKPSDSPAGPAPRPPYPRTKGLVMNRIRAAFRRWFQPAQPVAADADAYLYRQIGGMQ